MYAVKEKGRDGWQFFSENLQEQARQRLEITTGLRVAIERDELSVRFQPIVAAETGRIVGAELLLRWRPPQGEISPAVFIPIAETTGAIVSIGTWVFRAACRAESDWRHRWGDDAPYVSVNLSTRQLSESNLPSEFSAILQETGATPSRLLLEITETSLMSDVEANLKVLRRLAELGLRVAVDDFGTGYSSLAQLSRMPVDVLKIDRAFVDGIDKSPESRSIARAIIGLGRSLGLKLVAEGVENSAQQRELCGYGCDYIQGYYFHRPLEEATFIDTLMRDSRNDAALEGERLYFVLYVSRARHRLEPAERAQLLTQANKANRIVGISGCLLYRDGCFMQMLEGTKEQLEVLLDRIRCDQRHHGLRIIAEGPIRRRIFSDWGMVWRDLDLIAGTFDCASRQHRCIDLIELSEDPHLCYDYIAAYANAIPPVSRAYPK
jgi:EAL domain-containing protein (putative c-di-GMP-specific phosphodiesterase class I)